MTEKQSEPAYAWYALALLMTVYVLNFLDRTIIYILFVPIKAEFNFSDTQLVLLGTTSFVIFYTILGIPFGRMADRGSRTRIIAVGLAVWSLFSGLTGFAWDFWSLFFCRVMVGVGEATLGPAAISLLADYFSPGRRATVTSIYSMGIAIGAGLAAILGGLLSQIGWREAFFIVGFPGVLLAALVWYLREPERRTAIATEGSYSGNDWKKLLGNRRFLTVCLGYAFFGLATNSLSIWGAVYLNRIYSYSIPDIGYWLGIMTLAAGIPATLFGGAIASRFHERIAGGRLVYGAILCFSSAALWIVLLFSNNFALLVAVALVLFFGALAWIGAAAADVTEIAGANLRGLAVAIFFFAVNMMAFLIGSNTIGLLNDAAGIALNPATKLFENAETMRYTLLVCPASCIVGGILLLISRRTGPAGGSEQ